MCQSRRNIVGKDLQHFTTVNNLLFVGWEHSRDCSGSGRSQPQKRSNPRH